MLQNKENYNFNSVGDEIADAFNEGYKQGVEEFADFIKSQMGIERDYMGIKYKQGVFSDLDIDDFVKQFNNRDEEN
jgi:hypothetical protein